MFEGSVAIASKDVESMTQLLVDAEMKMSVRLSTLNLHSERHTDLLLGPGMDEALAYFPST